MVTYYNKTSFPTSAISLLLPKLYMSTYIDHCLGINIYIYIYIYRERERERERGF